MRLAAWTALYLAGGTGGFVLGWVVSGAANLSWFAALVVIWLVVTAMGKASDGVDGVDPPARLLSEAGEQGPPTLDPWVLHNGVLLRPETVPARVPSRGALMAGFLVVLVAGWIAGLIVTPWVS